MKTKIILLLLMFVCFAIVGCSQNANVQVPTTEPQTTEPITAEIATTEPPTTEPPTTEPPTEEPTTEYIPWDKREYETNFYDKIAREPEKYMELNIKGSGEIIQIMETSQDGVDMFVTRIAVDYDYDKVLFCAIRKSDIDKRFLEGDKVNFWGVSGGLYTYETVLGSEVTIPAVAILHIELIK